MTHEVKKQLTRTAAVTAAALSATLFAGAPQAQTLSTNSASFNGGWGRLQGTENHPIDVSTRDENGNRIIVDGVIQDGSENSEFVDTDASGAGSVFSGAGGRRRGRGGTATAIGNNLQVITTGSWNTVIVNSTQINNGNVTANSQPSNGEPDPND